MVEPMTDFQIILCTCADREQAERIAHRLVPRFPVEIGGVAELHAAFREKSRTRGCVPEPCNRKFGIELELAACVNIFPGVQSIYRWQGAVESAAESLILIKTRARLSNGVQSTISSLHSYEVPEFLVLPVSGGSESYLAWLEASLR
jgi:periplasmic divalent cation tolerance protein